jgi:hypothetical protein
MLSIKKYKIIECSIAVLFIAIGVLLRLAPHPANFAPIAALALFGGVYLPKKLAVAVPVTAMLISDIFLGFYEWPVAVAVYASFLFSCGLGFYLRNRKKWFFIGGGALLGSIVFFLSTNFMVWAFTPWYAKTAAGFIQCFVMALPFFKNTLLGDLFYTATFFGLYEAVNIFFGYWLLRRAQKIKMKSEK